MAVRPSNLSQGINRDVMANEVDGEQGSGEEGEAEAVFESIITETIEAEPEEVEMRELRDPSLPSQEEVDDHYARGHLPYRNWCPICVQSQGRDDDHPRDQDKSRVIPEYHF